MSEHPLELSGEEYWTSPWKNLAKLDERYLRSLRTGTVVDAPPRIDPAVRTTAPLLVYHVTRMRDAAKHPLKAAARVVATRLEDRAFRMAPLPTPDKAAPKLMPPTDTLLTQQERLDLQAAMRLLDESGTYDVALVYVDKLSNRVRVEVERKRVVSDDPEVVKFLEARRTPRQHPPPAPATPGVFALDTTGAPTAVPGTPPPPDAPGLAAAVDRVVLVEPDAHALLKGSFRVKVLPHEVVPPEPEAPQDGQDDADRPALPDYGQPRPTAIVPLHLLIVGGDKGVVTEVALRVPSFDPLTGDEPVATGSFAFDLLSKAQVRKPQTSSIYLFCGEHWAGPLTMATVTPEMLPKPGE